MVRNRPLSRRTLLMSAGTTVSIFAAGCLGDDPSDDSSDGDGGGSDDSTDSEDDSGSDDSGDADDSSGSDDSEAGNELLVVVMGEDGAVENAAVTVDGEEDETDEEGSVTFDGLDAGEYTVVVQADGFESDEADVEVGERNLTIHSVDLGSE